MYTDTVIIFLPLISLSTKLKAISVYDILRYQYFMFYS